MSSRNSRLMKPIAKHKRSGVVLFGKPKRGQRLVVVRNGERVSGITVKR